MDIKNVFEILIIHKPSLGSCEVPHKIWIRSVKPFIGYKQTDRQAKYIDRCRRILCLSRHATLMFRETPCMSVLMSPWM